MRLINDCTFLQTGKHHQNQYWRNCYTCFKDLGKGVCLTCAQLCHFGHRLGPIKCSMFYCDCGASGKCKAYSNVITPSPPIIKYNTPIRRRYVTPIRRPEHHITSDLLVNYIAPNTFRQMSQLSTRINHAASPEMRMGGYHMQHATMTAPPTLRQIVQDNTYLGQTNMPNKTNM
uniref:Ring finger protein n=1 Tax=Mimivirus LCMiAC01 TaxID=2506608 RepID=A0A481YZX6_9VIRU|nr:MAG: ring finger protein [Mimivirus LCMiAC01]